MDLQAYELEILSPFFYSSYEGNVISTDSAISSTALTYAIADALRLREKDYFLQGDDAITPKYEELACIPVFTSDASPIKIKYTQVLFKSSMFWAEENLQISAQNNPYPAILQKTGKSPFFKQVRKHIGIESGSKFQCILFSAKSLADNIMINIGIRKSGEVRLTRIQNIPETMTLNYFMLDKVYQVPKEKIITKGVKIRKGGDYRMTFLQDVPVSYFKAEILPYVVKGWN
jgi:hypothetical protein